MTIWLVFQNSVTYATIATCMQYATMAMLHSDIISESSVISLHCSFFNGGTARRLHLIPIDRTSG